MRSPEGRQPHSLTSQNSVWHWLLVHCSSGQQTDPSSDRASASNLRTWQRSEHGGETANILRKWITWRWHYGFSKRSNDVFLALLSLFFCIVILRISLGRGCLRRIPITAEDPVVVVLVELRPPRRDGMLLPGVFFIREVMPVMWPACSLIPRSMWFLCRLISILFSIFFFASCFSFSTATYKHTAGLTLWTVSLETIEPFGITCDATFRDKKNELSIL